MELRRYFAFLVFRQKSRELGILAGFRAKMKSKIGFWRLKLEDFEGEIARIYFFAAIFLQIERQRWKQ